MEGTNKNVEGALTFPLLISGSTVNEGTVYGVVVTVGEYTYIRQQTKLDSDDESPLQEKLEVIATQVG
jgi:magnesium-transporting ATPase (P-type)